MSFDIIIHNGIIVTVNPDFQIIENGFIGIKNGKIKLIQEKTDGTPLPEAQKSLDANGGIVMPGLVNTHTHLPMSLFRGLADDLPLMAWLSEYIFPAEEKHITPETVRIGALLSCTEMIMSGTTTCCDGYFFEDDTARAVNNSGIRAVLGQGIIDFPAPGIPDPKNSIQNVKSFISRWQNAYPRIIPSIFCHSPYTCSNRTLKDAKSVADANGLLFQIHVAETEAELKQIKTEHQTTPVKHLHNLGVLDHNTLLVHCIWVDDGDIKRVAQSGATISHNPESNMKLASGIAPVPAFLRAGITVGLGTDGCASNNDLDLFSEMDSAAKLHKVHALDSTVMDARTVLEMATIHGATAIGLEKEIGSLEIGKLADIIVINVNKPHLTPMYNPVSHLVYSIHGSDVQDVIIGGKIIVKDRRMITVDVEDLLENAVRIGKLIRQ